MSVQCARWPISHRRTCTLSRTPSDSSGGSPERAQPWFANRVADDSDRCTWPGVARHRARNHGPRASDPGRGDGSGDGNGWNGNGDGARIAPGCDGAALFATQPRRLGPVRAARVAHARRVARAQAQCRVSQRRGRPRRPRGRQRRRHARKADALRRLRGRHPPAHAANAAEHDRRAGVGAVRKPLLFNRRLLLTSWRAVDRSAHQIKFHDAFERCVARVIYRKDWSTRRPAIMRHNGWAKCSSEVMIRCALTQANGPHDSHDSHDSHASAALAARLVGSARCGH